MKLTKFLLTMLLTSLLAVGLYACSSAPTPDEVVEKINAGQQLDESDYQTMLDYLEDFVEAGEASANSYGSGREVGSKYPYFMVFAMHLDNAPASIESTDQYEDVLTRFIILMNR